MIWYNIISFIWYSIISYDVIESSQAVFPKHNIEVWSFICPEAALAAARRERTQRRHPQGKWILFVPAASWWTLTFLQSWNLSSLSAHFRIVSTLMHQWCCQLTLLASILNTSMWRLWNINHTTFPFLHINPQNKSKIHCLGFPKDRGI